MNQVDLTWGANRPGELAWWRSNQILYVLVGLFACVGLGLLGWNIWRNYDQTLQAHARQLDVGALVAEDYLSQALA